MTNFLFIMLILTFSIACNRLKIEKQCKTRAAKDSCPSGYSKVSIESGSVNYCCENYPNCKKNGYGTCHKYACFPSCDECNPGFTRVNEDEPLTMYQGKKCVSNAPAKIENCVVAQLDVCKQCKVGYKPNGKICAPAIDNCIVPDSESTCSQCATNWKLNKSRTKCVQCPDSKEYFLEDYCDLCSKKLEGCNTCEFNVRGLITCIQCKQGYVPEMWAVPGGYAARHCMLPVKEEKYEPISQGNLIQDLHFLITGIK